MTKAFLFDLAGVLIRWETDGLYTEIFSGDRGAVRRFFDEVLTSRHLAAISKGRSARAVVDELKAENPGYDRPLEAWIAEWDRMVTGPIEETVALSRELRHAGFATYILGNWSRDEFDRARGRFAFLDEFHGHVISGDHGVMKPSPEIFRIALGEFGLEPADTTFIDDTPGNIRAAERLGFETIHFTSAASLRESLRERGFLGRP